MHLASCAAFLYFKDAFYFFKNLLFHVLVFQRNPAIYNDSMIYLHLVMKVSALSVNEIGRSLTPEIKIGTQGTPETVVSVPTLTIQKRVKNCLITIHLAFSYLKYV